ncbi:hypothetical protein N7452_000849 [Penicillium brevicompactum]|uniref:Uncharacterized protein n=1 Tax=Penicillium brevicompactum TaxID=5074 RepID=A0A9W9R1G8_PENBR|nr:hypothetical protein N7452_000849 [Penicillium brevicompactum]
MDLTHPKQSPPDTQGSGLPRNKGSIKQPTIPVLGEEVENLNNWLAEVSFALKPLGIKRVLDSHIRRPTHSDSNYKIWQYWSTIVAGWLFSHVSEEIQNKLCHNKRRAPQSFLDDNSGMQYADEVMKAIIDLIQPGTKNDYVMNEVQKHRQITRARYRSAKEYIIAYRDQTELLRSKHAAPAPLYALTTIIRELKGELAVIDNIEREIAEHRSEETSWNIFRKFCKQIESECNKIQSGSGSRPTVHFENHNSNDNRDKSTSNTHGSW